MRFTRRGFIQTLGTGLAMTVPGCGRQELTLSEQLARWTNKEEVWKSSLCRLCPGGCGLKVRVIDGAPVQVRGNPLHPVNRGGICPRGAASLDLLCDPDRLTRPLRRQGRSDKWEPLTWDEAVDAIAGKLRELRSAGTPESVVLRDGQEPGLRTEVAARFARSFGTPNHVRYRSLEPETISLAQRLMQGGEAPLACDLSRVSYLLSFGMDLLESGSSPVAQMRAFADLRSGVEGRGGRVVVVSPRLSVTAARADRWVPIQPGTEGALALGIAHVLLRESLYDRDFVERNTFGFDDWLDEAGQPHLGFKSLILGEYDPLKVSAVTGVRPETILKLAREFASARPALAIGEPEYSWGPHDFYARMAVHSLNALTGNLSGPGTFAVQGHVPRTSFEEPAVDDAARGGLSRGRVDGAGEGQYCLVRDVAQALPERILSRKPYPIGALILLDANPVFSHPAGREFARAIASVPFVVSTSPYLDESAEMADLILPDAFFLERWDAAESRRHAGFSIWSVSEPAATPPDGARDSAEALMAIASKLGGAPAAALPWTSMKEMVAQASQGLYDARRGYVVSDDMDEAFRRILERQGFRDPEFSTRDDFLAGLLTRGAWWDPTDTSHELSALVRTPSGKFEFYSRALEEAFGNLIHPPGRPGSPESGRNGLRDRIGIVAEGDRMYLPHHEASARKPDERYPLLLGPFALLSLGDGRLANIDSIQEGLAVHVPEVWDSWVELNPATAAEYGVGNGDAVWVESARGRIRTRVRLFEGTKPGIAAMPLGQGHHALGRQARGRGANPLELTEDIPDTRAGMAVLGTTPVRIVRA